MISYERFKKICLNYNLIPCTRGGRYHVDNAPAYMINFNEKVYTLAGQIVCEYVKDRFNSPVIRVITDLEKGKYKIVTEEEPLQIALMEYNKQLNAARMKFSLRNIENDFV